ncbi:hypothetical protein F5887DRAFT_964721 [Amanita rubescens]|nr:hypothetical protein F5887DRAFT_964721 [Amanita rubescens]
MKLFSSYTLFLFGLISTVVAIGPPDEPGFITDKDIECSDPLPKYDTSGKELNLRKEVLKGDWVRMPHPHNLPRIDMMPAPLLPLTPFDFLSFGIIDKELCWFYITGHTVRSMKLALDEKPDAEPYAEGAHLESSNPNRLIRIIVVKRKSGNVEFLTRVLTEEEKEWTKSARFVPGVIGI